MHLRTRCFLSGMYDYEGICPKHGCYLSRERPRSDLVSVQGVELKSEHRPAPQGRICGCKSGVKTTSRSQKQSTSDPLVVDERFA